MPVPDSQKLITENQTYPDRFYFYFLFKKGVKTMNVEEEVERLKEEIRRLGKIQPDGSYKVSFSYLTSLLSIYGF